MPKIPLGHNRFALVSKQDYPEISLYNWYLVKMGNVEYAIRNSNKEDGGNRRTIGMHLQIMKLPKGQLPDHKSRDGLDNRRSNLRAASKRQNAQNRIKASHNKSGFKGVSWRKSHKLWQATIVIAGKQKHLIYSKCKEVAALVYDLAAILYFKEFSRTNFRRLK